MFTPLTTTRPPLPTSRLLSGTNPRNATPYWLMPPEMTPLTSSVAPASPAPIRGATESPNVGMSTSPAHVAVPLAARRAPDESPPPCPMMLTAFPETVTPLASSSRAAFATVTSLPTPVAPRAKGAAT